MNSRRRVNSAVRRYELNRMKTCLGIILVATAGILVLDAGKNRAALGPTKQDRVAASATSPNNYLLTGSSKTQNGYVRDEQTAIAIAVSAWIPIYGKAQIESEKPY